MSDNVISDVEGLLDESTRDDWDDLWLLRIIAVEYRHRMEGGDALELAATTARNYLLALRGGFQYPLGRLNVATLCSLHGLLLGNSEPTSIRKTAIAMRANAPGARLRFSGARPENVVSRLTETVDHVLNNESLSRFERIGLGYFEILRTHPFVDGNGRLCRLLLTTLLRNEFISRPLLGITHLMRADFGRYNKIIRNQDEDVYIKWLRYLAGLVRAELQAIRRFGAVLKSLDSGTRESLRSDVSQEISNCSSDCATSYDFEGLPSRQKRLAEILPGLLNYA